MTSREEESLKIIKLWVDSIESLAVNMGVSKREAAILLMQEFTKEARRLEHLERFGEMPDEYNPDNDANHPSRQWKPGNCENE